MLNIESEAKKTIF